MVKMNFARSLPLISVATATALLGSVAALAQQATTTAADRDAIVLDTVSVVARKTSEPVIDTLGGASVVTGDEIARKQAKSVSGLLAAVPGVITQDVQNDPQQAVNIRGLQDFGRVNVLVDGARQDYQISGHNANGSFYLDPEFISQIDVVRGPIANIYGSGAIGGVASFTTRGVADILDPDQTWGAEQKLGFDTNGLNFLTSTSLAARVGTIADFYGQFVWRDNNAYDNGNGIKVKDSGNNDFGGLIKANFHPAEGQTISLSALAQDFTYRNNGTSGTGTRWDADVKTGTYTLGYKLDSPDNPFLSLSAKLYLSQTQAKQTVLAPNATYAALGVAAGDKLSDKIDTWGFDISNTSRFTTAAFDHALTYGVDGAFDHVETKDEAGGYVSALTPSGDRTLAGAFIQDEIRYSNWLRILGGLRADTYALEGGSYSSDGSRLSPKLTIGITPIQGVEFYGTYAEGYRAPSITETLIAGSHPFPAFDILPNPNLRPEVAHNFEGGVNLKFDNVLQDGDRLRGKVTGFVNNVDDYIDMEPTGAPYLVPFIPGAPVSLCTTTPSLCFPVTSFQYVNVAKARLIGVEFEGAYDWGGGFLSLSGSHIDGRNLTTDSPLNTSPPDRVATTGALRFLDERLTIGSRLTFVADSEKSVSAPSKGYGLVDLFASYKVSDNATAAVAIDNVLDRQYKPFLASDAAPGLSAKFSLTMKLAGK